MIETLSRRKLIGGFGLLIAAPTIVKIANIMPVKAFGVVDDGYWFNAAEYEALNEASVEKMCKLIALQQRFIREGMKLWWNNAYTEAMANNYIGVGDPVRFIENPLLPSPNRPIATSIS